MTANTAEGESCCETQVMPHLVTDAAQQIAGDLQLLGHPIRLQILDMLSRHDGRICVCDIEETLPVKQPTVSHHLRLLREAGLIGSEKQGLYVYYFVNQDAVQTLWNRVQSQLAGII
jgi:ArsR family transcriptional regulator